MNIEKEREEFKDWLYLGQTEVEPDDLNKREVNFAWKAWKARAEIDIGRQLVRFLAEIGEIDKNYEPVNAVLDNKGYQPVPKGTREAPLEIPNPPAPNEPTDTEMLDWLIKNDALICHSVTDNLYEVRFGFGIDNVETGKTAREAIKKAMRGDK